MAQIATIVSEKIQFEILYVHNLGPRSRNDLECQYSQIFIHLIRCLLPLTFRSLAAIVSDKIHCFHFSCNGLESPMLHIKCRGNQPAGSVEEDFF